MVKKILKGAALVLLLLVVIGFGAFLYLIPPFFITSPEDLARPINDAAPATSDIPDPAQRAMAERGRYLVVTGAAWAAIRRPARKDPTSTSTWRAVCSSRCTTART